MCVPERLAMGSGVAGYDEKVLKTTSMTGVIDLRRLFISEQIAVI
jgi:hypothetical protein